MEVLLAIEAIEATIIKLNVTGFPDHLLLWSAFLVSYLPELSKLCAILIHLAFKENTKNKSIIGQSYYSSPPLALLKFLLPPFSPSPAALVSNAAKSIPLLKPLVLLVEEALDQKISICLQPECKEENLLNRDLNVRPYLLQVRRTFILHFLQNFHMFLPSKLYIISIWKRQWLQFHIPGTKLGVCKVKGSRLCHSQKDTFNLQR